MIRHFGDAIRQFAIDVALGQKVNMATVYEHDNIWHDFKTATMMAFENLDPENPKLELMPSYFGDKLTLELVSLEIAYGLGRSVFWLLTFSLFFTRLTFDI